MVRIGILGCGRIGQVHAGTLRNMDGATVVAVSDFMPAAAERLAKICLSLIHILRFRRIDRCSTHLSLPAYRKM